MTNSELQAIGERHWPDAAPEVQLSLATKLHNAKVWMRERGIYAFDVGSKFEFTEGPKVLRTAMVPT